jgi:hypothetical protein
MSVGIAKGFIPGCPIVKYRQGYLTKKLVDISKKCQAQEPKIKKE